MSYQESWTCEDLESWTCEAPKSRTREDPKPWTYEARSRELVKIWNLEPAKPLRSWTCEDPESRTGETTKSEICEVREFAELGSHGAWRFPECGDSRTSRMPSQRRRLKKFGFDVWTSGRLVNVWDVKDIHVHVHTRNIPWVRGYFRNLKVHSSPYKRGARARVKSFTTFEVFSSL
jgi:hypothetical protein